MKGMRGLFNFFYFPLIVFLVFSNTMKAKVKKMGEKKKK